MNNIMMRFNPQTYALMRIMAGFLFFCHGSQKIFGFPPSDFTGQVPTFITYGAGSIELIGGVLVMIGLFTNLAAFISSGEMAVAYWTAHGTKAFLPIVNKGELAVLYCFVFLFIASQGGGIWSIDATRNK